MELALHVVKIFTQDRVQQLFAELIPLFSLMILSTDRVQQRFVEQIFEPGVSGSASFNVSGLDEGAPVVMGAPSRIHGPSFILKPQLLSASWRRTSTREG